MSTWRTYWKAPAGVTLVTSHGDYRDHLPLRSEVVAEELAPVVKDGSWTFGLLECWGGRERLVKSAVHVPCCPSFRFNPLKWRGLCFGRSTAECFWFGIDRTRWSRTVYALGLGREYRDPFIGIGRSYPDEIAHLCGFVCCLGCAFGLGLGQAISICGNYGVNFAACFTCHAREKMRRRFKLPPAFCLPPGIDDCLVHFICMYCASHQEMREAIVRGLDGPGMSPLDVHPSSWRHVEGFQAEIEHRQRRLAQLQEGGELFLPFEQRMTRDMKATRARRQARRNTGPGKLELIETQDSSLLQHGPSDALQGSTVEMAMMSTAGRGAAEHTDIAAELATLTEAPTKQKLLRRSNSIVF